MAIKSFSIEKDKNSNSAILYRIVRSEKGEEENTFRTLSEGEKMIISFLYFIELCKGKQNEADTNQNKIIIIDDPISSLSHIYAFDIAQIIKNIFINDQKYSQVFIFTHSLYFFHELTKILKAKNPKLFRLIKNENGSELKDMNPEEIQNDYQSFWQIIKDVNQPPALIANCMRHIIEYFFGFIEKIELEEVLEKKDLNINRYEAFFRYMNRESHSDGINIFDNGEFEHGCFKDAFNLVFEKSGYINHYLLYND